MSLPLTILSYIITFFSGYFCLEKVYKRWVKPGFDKYLVKHMFTYNNDSFAHDTIRYRFREIMYTLNNYYEEAVVKLSKGKSEKELMDLIKNRPFSYSKMMKDDFSEPKSLFAFLKKNDYFDDNDKTVLEDFYSECRNKKDNIKGSNYGAYFSDLPFIDAEHVFYFYILDTFYGLNDDIKKYMSDNTFPDYIPDPYKKKKRKAIEDDLCKGLPNDENSEEEHSSILECLKIIIELNKILEGHSDKGMKSTKTDEKLKEITNLSLYSNTNDLSQLRDRVRKVIDNNSIYPNNLEYFLKCIKLLKKDTKVNYLVDNSGVEFFSDLTFAYVLIQVSNINKVSLLINKLPIFVSDVIESDYEHMINIVEKYLKNKKNNIPDDYLKALELIKDKIKEKQIELHSDFNWNMPTSYDIMAKNGYKEVFTESNSILIIKGDLNYRRLVTDKNWHYSDDILEHTDYIECPTLVVRSIKSDLVIDYDKKGKKKYTEWEKKDKYWRENGEYGVIRFINDPNNPLSFWKKRKLGVIRFINSRR